MPVWFFDRRRIHSDEEIKAKRAEMAVRRRTGRGAQIDPDVLATQMRANNTRLRTLADAATAAAAAAPVGDQEEVHAPARPEATDAAPLAAAAAVPADGGEAEGAGLEEHRGRGPLWPQTDQVQPSSADVDHGSAHG